MPSNPLGVSREQLRQFLPNHETIRAFEQLLADVGVNLPDTVEQANNNANTAIAMAAAAVAALAEITDALDAALSAPAALPHEAQEDYSPAPFFPCYSVEDVPANQVGTLGVQNENDVDISGGQINDTTIGAATPSSGAFTTLTASSTVNLSPANANVTISPTGTGTVGIAPNTAGNINNMAIGGTTPRAGGFTTLTTSGNAGIGLTASFRLHVQRGSSGISSVFQGSGSSVQLYLEHDETNLINYVGSSGSSSRPLGFKSGNTELARFTATGNLLLGTTTDGMAASGSLAIAKDFAHRGANIGFFSTTPINKLTVTGSRGGNAALASLLTQLATYGFITDSSTV